MANESRRNGKIAVIGSHGVGKSTMCDFLRDNYFAPRNIRSEVMKEVASEMPKYGLFVNENTSFEAQAKIQELQRLYELRLEEKLAKNLIDYAILDRSVVDNYAYAERRFPEKSREILFEPVKEWLSSHPYFRTIYIPVWNPDEELTADGFRSTSKEFQLDMEARIRRLIAELGMKIRAVPERLFLLPEEKRNAAFSKFFDKIFS